MESFLFEYSVKRSSFLKASELKILIFLAGRPSHSSPNNRGSFEAWVTLVRISNQELSLTDSVSFTKFCRTLLRKEKFQILKTGIPGAFNFSKFSCHF